MPETSISFEQAADYYDGTRGYPEGVAARVAAHVASAGQCDGTQQLLEIGVGTGRVALPLAAHVRRVVGVDLADSMLRRLMHKRTGESVVPVRSDIARLPFADGYFDRALSLHILHLVPSWQSALHELARVMSPAGLYLAAADGRALRPIWDEVNARTPAFQSNLAAPHMPRDYPTLVGFEEAGPPHRFQYTHTVNVKTAIEELRARVWSSTWHLSQGALENLADTFEQVTRERYGRIPSALEDPRTFTVRVYRPAH